jgi:DGQHR domain-containing protein
MYKIRTQRFRQRHNGEPVFLYLATLPAEAVTARKKIEIKTADNPKGYQRRLEPSRVNSIARYVIRGEGLLPTSLLLNIREGAHYEPSKDDENWGWLIFDDEEELWRVIDGQHRAGGVEAAIDQRNARIDSAKRKVPEPLEYDLPLVFCLGFPRDEEMELFKIVNSKAKSVSTDLVASLIYGRVTDERAKDEPTRISLTDLRKAAGISVALYLADRAPWKGHILEVNEAKDQINKPMQANTIASTLLPAMRDAWIQRKFLENPKDLAFTDLAKVVQQYWEVLAELMPEAFADIEHYAVQRPIGVYSFNEILADILDICRMSSDYSPAHMKRLLSRLGEWVDSDTWDRREGGPGEDIVKGSGNRAATRVVVSRMRSCLNEPLDGLGSGEDMPDIYEAADKLPA